MENGLVFFSPKGLCDLHAFPKQSLLSSFSWKLVLFLYTWDYGLTDFAYFASYWGHHSHFPVTFDLWTQRVLFPSSSCLNYLNSHSYNFFAYCSCQTAPEHGPTHWTLPELLPVRLWRVAGEARDPWDQLPPQCVWHPPRGAGGCAQGSVFTP